MAVRWERTALLPRVDECLIGGMSNVLILGGTSWVGGQIALEAADRGHNVTCVARGESGEPPPGVTFAPGDRERPNAYDAVVRTAWDMVFDVSWQPGFVRDAVEALGASSSHWTYVSSSSVYADQSVGGDESAAVSAPLEADRADWDTYSGAKAACEHIVQTLPTTLVARVGLVGGPGDRTDRLGYWVARFAAAGDGPVLVPDVLDQPTQTVDVRDLAAFLVESAEVSLTGVFNVAGEQMPLGEVIDRAAQMAGFGGERVVADIDWLGEHDVAPWMGPRSLPMWAPDADGMGSRDTSRALEAGLRLRPFDEMLADVLTYERSLGLDRPRRAGLSRSDELDLIDALR